METPFYKTELGKIINNGIHDINGPIGSIHTNIELLKRIKFEDLTEEELNKRMTFILDRLTKVNAAVDYIYSETKKLTNG